MQEIVFTQKILTRCSKLNLENGITVACSCRVKLNLILCELLSDPWCWKIKDKTEFTPCKIPISSDSQPSWSMIPIHNTRPIHWDLSHWNYKGCPQGIFRMKRTIEWHPLVKLISLQEVSGGFKLMHLNPKANLYSEWIRLCKWAVLGHPSLPRELLIDHEL